MRLNSLLRVVQLRTAAAAASSPSPSGKALAALQHNLSSTGTLSNPSAATVALAYETEYTLEERLKHAVRNRGSATSASATSASASSSLASAALAPATPGSSTPGAAPGSTPPAPGSPKYFLPRVLTGLDRRAAETLRALATGATAQDTAATAADTAQPLPTTPAPQASYPSAPLEQLHGAAAFEFSTKELMPPMGKPLDVLPSMPKDLVAKEMRAEQDPQHDADKAKSKTLSPPGNRPKLADFYNYLGVSARPSNPRDLELDPVYDKMLSVIMEDGKKEVARKLLNEALAIIKTKTRSEQKPGSETTGTSAGEVLEPLDVLRKAVENVKPLMTLTPMRKSGATHQVPVPLTEKRRLSLGVKWIVNAARSRKGMPFPPRLAQELLDASRSEGKAMLKKIETHKMCEGNRANMALFAKRL